MNQSKLVLDDPLSVIEVEAREVAVSYGAKWSDEATDKLIRRLVVRLGGSQLYIPRLTSSARNLRDNAIRDQFDGANIKRLAKDFAMSERTIRRVLANNKKR